MQNSGEEKPIETPTNQLVLNLGLDPTPPKSKRVRKSRVKAGKQKQELDPNQPRKFLSKYTALISLLPIAKDQKLYKKESFILSKIIKKGFSARDIYLAFNYWRDTKKREINSYAFFLWNNCTLLTEALNHTIVLPKDIEQVKLDKDKDYRQLTFFDEPKKSLLDKLS